MRYCREKRMSSFFYWPCFFHWPCAHEAESHLKSYSATVLAVKTGENSMAVGNARGWKVFDAKYKIELIAISWQFWWTNRWWWDQTSAWEDFWQDLSQRFLVQLQVGGSSLSFSDYCTAKHCNYQSWWAVSFEASVEPPHGFGRKSKRES